MSAITPEGQKPLREVTSYTYYIVYQWDGGFGSSLLKLDYPLNNWERITAAADLIANGNKRKRTVVLTNWILL
jgi:hypothetical protein